MPNELLQNYNRALEALYKHVGFVEDWVVYPIEDRSGMYWQIVDNQYVKWALTKKLFAADNCYEEPIDRQRFYEKWVYEGKKLTMIMVNTQTDGNKFFAFYSNNRRLL